MGSSAGAAASAGVSSLAGASAWPEVSASEEVQRVFGRVSKKHVTSDWNRVYTYEVVTEQLHDESGVLVALLAEGVELCNGCVSKIIIIKRQGRSFVFSNVKKKLTSNSIVEGLLGEVASLVGSVENLVVEDGEVEGKTQADGVGRRQLGLGNLGGSLVSLERLVCRVLAAVANGELGKVTVVVTLPVTSKREIISSIRHAAILDGMACAHLVVEDLGLARLGRGDQVLVKNVEDVVADLGKLVLDLLAVLLDEGDLGRVALRLLLLLDRSNYSPRGAASTNDVLVGDGEKVALLDGQVAVLGGDDLHVLNHLYWRLQSAQSIHRITRENKASNEPSYRSACSASLAR